MCGVICKTYALFRRNVSRFDVFLRKGALTGERPRRGDKEGLHRYGEVVYNREAHRAEEYACCPDGQTNGASEESAFECRTGCD